MAGSYTYKTKQGVVRVVRVHWLEATDKGKIRKHQDLKGYPGETVKDFNIRKRDLEIEYARGLRRPGQVITVKELSERWVENHVVNLSATAQRGYRGSLRDHILPVIGHLKVDDVTDLDIEKMIARSRNTRFDGKKAKPSSSSVGKHFDVCRNMFNYAVNSRSIPIQINPCQKGMRPPDAYFEGNIIQQHQLETFVNLIKDSRHVVSYWLGLSTGIRRSEILGLRVKDVVPELAELSIVKKLVYVKERNEPGVYIHEEVKKNRRMGQGIRTIGIDPNLSLLLKDYLEEKTLERIEFGLRPVDGDDLLFPGTIEGDQSTAYMNPDSWSDEFRKRIRGSEFEGKIRPHDMRHTHATLLYWKTKDITLVQRRLGHHDSRFTQERYANKAQPESRSVDAWAEITQSISQNNLDIIESQNDKENEN